MSKPPIEVIIRSYQVGFGDCFLLTFRYDENQPGRHVLIDFGTTGLPGNKKKDAWMLKVASDIAAVCDGKLDAVVATHRHQDHISGFATKKNGKGTGDIIRGLSPKVVIQPWTEDPDAKPKARTSAKIGTGSMSFKAALGEMNAFAGATLKHIQQLKSSMGPRLFKQLTFLGENNIKNRLAVENLMTMGKKQVYVAHNSKSGLEKILPGVKVHVLGPPTLEQSEAIASLRSKDPDEFWHLQRLGLQQAQRRRATFRGDGTATAPPPHARWFIPRLDAINADQLLAIVRSLDDAMNNTSVILLFEVGKQKLLFPGDAQIENWSYALMEAPNHKQMLKRLSDVSLYKVGHHGSLNATPKTLWNGFAHRGKASKQDRLQTLVSTMSGKHGSPERGTEVPRAKLVDALEHESHYRTTQSLKAKELCHTVTIRIT